MGTSLVASVVGASVSVVLAHVSALVLPPAPHVNVREARVRPAAGEGWRHG